MKKVSGAGRRTAFIVAGVVVAGVAFYLVFWGMRALLARPDQVTDNVAPPTTTSGESQEQTTGWVQFTRGEPSSPDAALDASRPIELPATGDPSPFDEAFARMELGRLGLRFQGVAQGSQQLALISGRVVRVGDNIAGYSVASINRSGVSLLGPNGVRVDLGPSAETDKRRLETEHTVPSPQSSAAEVAEGSLPAAHAASGAPNATSAGDPDRKRPEL